MEPSFSSSSSSQSQSPNPPLLLLTMSSSALLHRRQRRRISFSHRPPFQLLCTEGDRQRCSSEADPRSITREASVFFQGRVA
ncbi:hypothetical protein LOK49_LG04G00226 [Camellia lanceoleosa]|uniref:Uncharacterized protein n=1 Tax=Camellia lanceoleosa TaxID=1840588 RepID=A0ACC0I0A9_9ERIC|nr:hypothetical protein LOK49_LG04G00226 [Camellia lanceoleosa]